MTYISYILNEFLQSINSLSSQATDDDETDVLRFRILSGNPGDVWQIGETSGEITAVDPVDFEAIPGEDDQ